MDIKINHFDSPILIIGYRGFPINRFCYDVYLNRELYSKCNFSAFDNVHQCYSMGVKDFKKAMSETGMRHKFNNSLSDFVNYRYFKNPIKRLLYSLYLSIGKLF